MKKIVLAILFLSSIIFAREINANNFDKIIKSHKLVLVDFWQPNCPGCQMLKPNFEKAKRALGNKALFVSYNVRQMGDPVSKYQIYTTPTMILFKNGKEVDRNYLLGYREIIDWVNSYR